MATWSAAPRDVQEAETFEYLIPHSYTGRRRTRAQQLQSAREGLGVGTGLAIPELRSGVRKNFGKIGLCGRREVDLPGAVAHVHRTVEGLPGRASTRSKMSETPRPRSALD